MKNKGGIYLDYAAATPIEPAVLFAMQKTYKEYFASPSSIHGLGMRAKNILDQARKEIAQILHCHDDEILFTSGSTESNNLAILGVVNASQKPIPHIVTSSIEHSSVLEVFKDLEKNKKAEVTYLEVDEKGMVDPRMLRKVLKKNTILISIMYANSEIGIIQPIHEIAKEIRHFSKSHNQKIYFHTDATQAMNYLQIDMEKLGVDFLTWSGVKIYGPRGIGALYVKRNSKVSKIMLGGDQQFNMRAGSYNLPGIVGFAKAMLITEKIKEKESKRLTILRDYFFKQLMSKSAFDVDIIINGSLEERLPNNINITIPKIPSDLLVIELSARGIMASAKSACKAGDGKDSHVIRAIRQDETGSVRFSMGRQTVKKDIDMTLKALKEILKKLKKWYN